MRLPLALSVLTLCALPALAQDGFRWVVDPLFEDAGASQDGAVPLLQGGL